MKKLYLLLFLSILGLTTAKGQIMMYQYFDGNDTGNNSIFVQIDTAGGSIWQIGPPQKAIFDSAATFPNVIVTDTINFYPPGDTSSFILSNLSQMGNFRGVHAIRWKQKLDMDFKGDGGMIEYSLDTGNTWLSVFDNPNVYNFYGFDTTNVDTVNGVLAFTGTDTVWRDIWMCFDRSYTYNKELLVRFTFVSDTTDTQKEGWMIDNFIVHETMIHTVKKTPSNEYLKVYPTLTTGRVHIEAEKLYEYHIIEGIRVVNTEGKTVRSFGQAPTKFFIDIGDLPNGTYYINIRTNKRSQTFPVTLGR